MLNANASSVKTGDKVIVIDRIPPRVLKDRSSVELPEGEEWDDTHLRNGIPRGALGRIKDVGTATVTVEGYKFTDVIISSFKDHVFEKYFAVQL